MSRRANGSGRRTLSAALVVSLLGVAAVATAADAGPNDHGIDNVVVIVVDDMAFDEMIAMPKTEALLGDSGVTFTNSFVNTSNCCPSRATLITGQRSSNHGVVSTDWSGDPHNSYMALDHDDTLPVWLSAAGYETIHVGKYLNGYGHLGLDPAVPNQQEVPPGWTDFHAFVGEKRFTNFTMSENGEVNTYQGDDNYQTDVLSRISVQAVSDAVQDDKPFFMWVTPFAPHKQSGNPPVPATRHEHAFDGIELPRPANFNEVDVSDKPGFVRNAARLTDNGSARSDVAKLRDLYEGRLESLLAVDDLVENVVQRLDDEGVLDSTLVVFSSDNGYMMGNHRLEGKIRVYEESIRVPLLMSGGPFTGGVERAELVSNLDLAPTFLSLLGIAPGNPVDGVDLTDVVDEPERYANRALIIESEGGPGYHAVRTPDWMYVEYEGSGIELYDMVTDSQQLESLHRAATHATQRVALATVLAALRSCRGAACAVDANGNALGSVPPTTTTTSTTTTSSIPPTTTTTSTTTTTTTSSIPPTTTTTTTTTSIPPTTTTTSSSTTTTTTSIPPTTTTSSSTTTTTSSIPPTTTTTTSSSTTTTTAPTDSTAPATSTTTTEPVEPDPDRLTPRVDGGADHRGLSRASRLGGQRPG